MHDQLRMAGRQLPVHEAAARRTLVLLEQQVATLPANEHTFGLIHYDFELDNLLWGDQVRIVDFDDCAWYCFVADIAFALRDLFDDQAENIDMTDERFRAFITGYRLVRMVTDEELGRLPLFLRLHNLLTFVKLLRASDSRDEAGTPAWVTDLQAKLMRKAQSYRDGFDR
jgi:Ser/Thr protein kinase RdoA (MazF antagonist)